MEENEYFKLSISRVFDRLLSSSQKDDEVTLNDITRCQSILLKEREIQEDLIRKKICKKLNVDFCYSPKIWYTNNDNIFRFTVKEKLTLTSDYDIDMELIKNENGELSIFKSTNSEYAFDILNTSKEEVNEYYNFKEEERLMYESKYYNINIDSNTKIIVNLNFLHIFLGIYSMLCEIMWLTKWYHDNEFKIDVRYPECFYENINSLINNNLFIKIKDLPPYMQEKLYTIRKEQLNNIRENKDKINKLILKSKKQKHK